VNEQIYASSKKKIFSFKRSILKKTNLAEEMKQIEVSVCVALTGS
jgi:hypothetical protein